MLFDEFSNWGYNKISMDEKVYDKNGNELITPQEADKMGYTKESTIRMRLKAGTLKGIKKGAWLVRKDDVRKQPKN